MVVLRLVRCLGSDQCRILPLFLEAFPGNSFGNTSMNSSTTDILSAARLNTIGSWVGGRALHETDFPWWSVRRIALPAQLMMPLCLVNQSIPRITSIPWDGSTAKSTKNTTPLKIILSWEHLRWHRRSDPGVRVTKGISRDAVGMPCFSTKTSGDE
jgi:hypothetical protein